MKELSKYSNSLPYLPIHIFKKYYMFFKIRFASGLQYRAVSLAALSTQLIWGLMECLLYKVVADAFGNALPMDYKAIVTYIWLKEALLGLFNTWNADNDIFGMIMNGDVAYELCRPLSVYTMWFSRNVGGRMAETLLRCLPVLFCAFLMPEPYRMTLPVNMAAFGWFLFTMFLGIGITVAFCTLVYMLCFFTISPKGWKMVFTGAVDFLSGNIIPLPFFPASVLAVVNWFPFAYMQNVPFRIYCGDLVGKEILVAVRGQFIWLFLLIGIGSLLWRCVEKRIVIQGG